MKCIFGECFVVYVEKFGVMYLMYVLLLVVMCWGSCLSDGKICLNWWLIYFLMLIIDYVVVYELLYLCEMNYSLVFW